jgi:hypothetical protein
MRGNQGRLLQLAARRSLVQALVVGAFIAMPSWSPGGISAQTPDSSGYRGASAAPMSSHYWRDFDLGAATSVLAHELAHVGVALALGKHPTFGFDELRPTIYSGINSHIEPHKQFLFSAAGLTAQSVIDEAILDIPHDRGAPFERGVLAGGIGTTLFYLTIGRWGSVSDVDFMARTHALTKTQITLIYGSVAAFQSLRIWHDARYADFFVAPHPNGPIEIGFALPASRGHVP